MWIPDSTTRARGRQRARDLAGGPSLACLLLIALAACGGHVNTSSGVNAAPVSSSSAPVSSSAPGSGSSAPESSTGPTMYVGAVAMPEMSALLQWHRTASTATGTVELSGTPHVITGLGPGTYPLRISFAGDSFTGSLEVSGQQVSISGQLTATGVDLTFDASPAANPTLDFTSTGAGSYSYPPR
jgi:hypothetical protein